MSAVFCFHNQNNSTSSPGSIPWNMYRCTCITTLVSWCRLRRRRNEIIFFFSCLQLDALRSLKMNNTMNIVDNYRPVQNLGSRKVKSNFSSTQAPPTTTAVTVPTEAASFALKISNVLLMLHWCSSWEKFSSTEWSARPGSLPKEAAGGGEGGNNVFLYSLGAVQVGLGNFFATLGYIFSSTFANLFMLDFIFLCSYRYQSNSWELVTLWNHYN